MSNNNQRVVVSSQGVGFCGSLFIILLLLKVGVVDTIVVGWSWWWITSPLWAPICLVLSIIAIILVVMLVIFLGGLLIATIIGQCEKKKNSKQTKK